MKSKEYRKGQESGRGSFRALGRSPRRLSQPALFAVSSIAIGLAGLPGLAHAEPPPEPSVTAPLPPIGPPGEPTVVIEGGSIVNLGATQRLAAYGVAGAGLVSALIGLGLGLQARAFNDDANSCHCTNGRCDYTGLSRTVDANQAAFASTVLFAAGGALIATGVVLYLTAPSRPAQLAVAPAVGPGTAGVAFRGAF